jgi:GTP-binding protein
LALLVINVVPVIAIIGRPNVGKSTLFNCLTRSRDALVADFPGLTRDRLYGEGRLGNRPYIVIDTGGLFGPNDEMSQHTGKQTQLALAEASHILFLVDARSGLTSADQTIADQLRASGKTITLVVNKIDGLDATTAVSEFYTLGFNQVEAIEDEAGIKIAVIGRPNVGKSTLINRMLGEERVVVFDQPGTTRDSIYIPFERHGKHYTLIDTAGVRRKGRIKETIEKFSVVKTLQAIQSCHVAVFVVDAQENITEQDLHLLGFIIDAGKALVIAVNKWDGLSNDQRERIRSELDRRLAFLDFAEIKFISALHGTGVGELYPYIEAAFASANRTLVTSELTRLLEKAIATHQPPAVSGRRIKLRYAHAGGQCPPKIIIHGKQTRSLPESYRRYLIGFFRKALKLTGTPIKIEFRDSDNPYI